MKLVLVAAFAALTFAAPARAAKSVDYCVPVKKLTDRLSSCTDNEILFGDAAVSCLDKFEADATATAAELQKTLLGAGANADDAKSQQALLQGTEKNYAETKLRLGLLIASGQRALQQIGEYRANPAMPEDFESAESMGFTTDAFLKSIPCFEENRQLMVDVGQDILDKLTELKGARDAVAAMEKASGAAKDAVGADSNGSSAAVTNSHAGGEAATFKSGTASGGASDITGTERKPSDVIPANP
ncbi:MAG: hypothetical protein ACXVB9_16260 [Bdellovibrionota bacterium]